MVDAINNSSSVSTNYSTAATTNSAASNTAAAKTEAEKSTTTQGIEDTYEKSGTSQTAAPKEKGPLIEKLLAESEAKVNNFKSLIEKLITKQGRNDEIAAFDGTVPMKDYMQNIINGGVDQETIDKAKEAVSEDGEFGVKKVAERILDFAKALIGDDMSKFDKIKDSVMKGFSSAQEAWGDDDMPEITKQTKAAITSVLDQWEKDGSTQASLASVTQKAAEASQGVNK